MQPNRCSFCESRHPGGFLWGDVTLQICRACRDEVLTYLNSIGVSLNESNPFIAELCLHSHTVEDAWWNFYDSINQTSGTVMKLVGASKRDNLRRVKCGFTGNTFFVES